jgi:hypothetical protein
MKKIAQVIKKNSEIRQKESHFSKIMKQLCFKFHHYDVLPSNLEPQIKQLTSYV